MTFLCVEAVEERYYRAFIEVRSVATGPKPRGANDGCDRVKAFAISDYLTGKPIDFDMSC